MKVLREIRRALLETVYPEGAVCLGCGRVSRGECLCPECRSLLLNGEMLESWETRTLKGIPVWSMKPHRGLARKLVLRLKHGAEARAAAELAGVLRTRPDYALRCAPGTVVTFVPSPERRILERYLDHGRLLAEAAAKELGLPCRPLLRRRGNHRPQARLNRAQRERNLEHAFEPLEKISFPVLLVDDVITTGTTALRCAEALRKAGAEDITILTATRAVR